MKHLRTTPLRWLSRVPGRIYRNQWVRLLTCFVVLWEAVYFGTLWITPGGRNNHSMNVLSWAGSAAMLLALMGVNWFEIRKARKFMKEGVAHFEAGTRRYMLGVLAKIENKHGRYLTLPGPKGVWAVKCACGQHIGNTTAGIPNFDQPLVKEWETHVEAQVKTVMDQLEGRLSEHVGR